MPQPQRKKPKANAARKSSPSSTAIVPSSAAVNAKIRREYSLKQEQIDLIRSTLCRGASDEELRLFLWVAKKHRLDPLTRQLHAVKRYTKKHHQDEKGIWVEGEVMSIQIGIDGYRSMAARYRDFGGVDEPEYEFAKAGDKIPIMARVRLWKKGFDHPSVGIAFWDEYAPNLQLPTSFMWAKMPKHMLAKCAEALALRKAYPELADIYTDEEMAQADQDYTPGGRQIVGQDGTAPSGRPVTYEAQHRGKLDETAAHGHLPGSQKATQAEEQLRKVEEADKALKARSEASKPPIDLKPSQNAPVSDPRPILRAERTPKGDYIITGDVDSVIDTIQKNCVWFQDFWHATKHDLTELSKAGLTLDIPPEASSGGKERPENKTSKPTGGRQTAAAPELVSGPIERVTAGMTSKNAPTRQVKIGKAWYTSYVNTIFEFLDKGVGKEAEVFIDARKQLIGLKRIGKTEFDTDGRTPIVHQKDREAGGSLFGT